MTTSSLQQAAVNETMSVTEFRSFFLGEVERAYPEIERTDRLPEILHRRAAEIGCYRLTLPAEYGGFGLGVMEYLPYLEASAEGPGIGRMLVHLTNGTWRPLSMFGHDGQRSIIRRITTGDAIVAFCLTEQAGGTGRDIRSRAVREGDVWRISGEKHLITFADRATHFILIAASDDRRTQESLTAFLIPRSTPGFEIDTSQHTMGLHGTGHAFLRYENMVVPDAQRLGTVGQGLKVALSFLDYSRVSLSCCMVGLAQRALDEAVAFAKRRSTFGKQISERQAMQGHIATMHADVEAGRHLVRHAAQLCANGAEYTAAAATAKLFCLNMIGRVTDLSLRVHGGWGYTKRAAIERVYRDARGFWFEEGTAEIQQLVVARHVLDNA